MKVKWLIRAIPVLFLVLMVCAPSESMAKRPAVKCKVTKYKSFKEAIAKSYDKNLQGNPEYEGVSYDYVKLKTKFGMKKCIAIHSKLGACGDCAIYFKHGNKIYDLGIYDRTFIGVSSNGMYVMTNLSGVEYTIWKYTKGKYKPIIDNQDVDYEKLRKKYGIIWPKHTKKYTPPQKKTTKKNTPKKKSSKKIPSKVYGVYAGMNPKDQLKLTYKKGYMTLKGYYANSWLVYTKRYKINKKYKVAKNCIVEIRADGKSTKEKFKNYIKERFVFEDDGTTIIYIGCQVTIKKNKIVKIAFGD